MDTKEVLARCKEDNVKFVSFQFTDIIGNVKSVDAHCQSGGRRNQERDLV